MKDVSEWDEEYILNGIPLGEHDWVEFKRSEKLDLTLPGVRQSDVINELSKQVSAFANGSGGVIVYGIDDKQTTRTVDESGGVSMLIKKNGTKEWLEDVIPNAVEFQLEDFNVYAIIAGSSDSSIQSGKAVYAIRIGNSERAPHQANDKVYYARVGGKSRPISHRMVMDIAARQKHPEIIVIGEITNQHSYSESMEVPTLILRFKNVGSIFANFVNGWIKVPKSVLKHFYGETVTIEGTEYVSEYFENTISEVVGYRKGTRSFPGVGGETSYLSVDEPLTLSRYSPLLPGLSHRVFREETIEIEELEANRDLPIHWEVYADNAPIKRGQILVADLISMYKELTDENT